MSSRILLALFALCLVLAAGPAVADPPAADAPVCATHPLDLPAAPAVDEDGAEDGAEATLEDILATSPEDPQTRAIDSGICCYSKSECPTVSGYAKRCSSGSCWSAYTCLYRPL